MVPQLHRTGEEILLRFFFTQDVTIPTEMDVGLFHDGTDQLTNGAILDDITTEATGASYSRGTVTLGTDFTALLNSNENWQIDVNGVPFDATDSDESVNAYFLIANFESNETSDFNNGPHLIWSGLLDREYDLSGMGTFTLNGASLTID